MRPSRDGGCRGSKLGDLHTRTRPAGRQYSDPHDPGSRGLTLRRRRLAGGVSQTQRNHPLSRTYGLQRHPAPAVGDRDRRGDRGSRGNSQCLHQQGVHLLLEHSPLRSAPNRHRCHHRHAPELPAGRRGDRAGEDRGAPGAETESRQSGRLGGTVDRRLNLRRSAVRMGCGRVRRSRLRDDSR